MGTAGTGVERKENQSSPTLQLRFAFCQNPPFPIRTGLPLSHRIAFQVHLSHSKRDVIDRASLNMGGDDPCKAVLPCKTHHVTGPNQISDD